MFGNWKKKLDVMKMVILSGGHQNAKELDPSVEKLLDAYRRVATTGDATGLEEELAQLPTPDDSRKPLWEPAEANGWKFSACFYRRIDREIVGDENVGDLWWLVHVTRKDPMQIPGAADLKRLDHMLEHLGAGVDPSRRMIIGPTSSPPGEPPIPFGWWTWKNTLDLFEVQVNKAKKGRDVMRIVPLGTRPSDGYEPIELRK